MIYILWHLHWKESVKIDKEKVISTWDAQLLGRTNTLTAAYLAGCAQIIHNKPFFNIFSGSQAKVES